MTINRRLKMLRVRERYTIKELASKLNVSIATAQRYESDNGIKAIPYEIIEKYSTIFGVSPSYIMGWTEDNKNDGINELIEVARNLPEDELNRLIKYAEFVSKYSQENPSD